MSVPRSSRWVAKLWRSVCRESVLRSPAAFAACLNSRPNWRVVSGRGLLRLPARGRRHTRSAAFSTIAATGRGPLPAASRAGPPLSRGQALETLRLHDADDHLLTVDVARPQPHHLARPQSATKTAPR